MCGIAGIVYADPQRPLERDLLERMGSVIAHRGPDAGTFHAQPGQHSRFGRWGGNGWISHVIGGWRLSGVGIFATGRPLVLLMPVSNGPTGIGAYAKVIGDLRLPGGQQTYDRWFNNEKDPAKGPAVLPPDAFTLGDGTRTFPQVRGPKVKRLDLLLSRLQKIRTTTLELRVEAQNALNTPQLADPVGDYNSVSFGRIITGGGERRLQLGLRLGF